MVAAPRITLRKRKRAPAHDAFEEEFAIESLKSDRLRVTILIGVVFSSVLLIFLMTPIFFDQLQTAFHGQFRGFLIAVGVVFGANLAYLTVERIVIDRLIKRKARPSTVLRYLSAFVETTIPTAGMIVGSLFLGPIYTLFTPAAFLYPLFISLSAYQ